MKIIKEGKLPQPKVYRGICKNCETEIEVTEGEEYYVGKNSIGNRCFGIKCPLKLCNHNITVRETS